MTEKTQSVLEVQREAKTIREDYAYLVQSETIRFYLRRSVTGSYIHDIFALDRGIRQLHDRLQEAEKEAQLSKAEAVYYRRKAEALEIERREEEENRFPLFNNQKRGDEDEHGQA